MATPISLPHIEKRIYVLKILFLKGVVKLIGLSIQSKKKNPWTFPSPHINLLYALRSTNLCHIRIYQHLHHRETAQKKNTKIFGFCFDFFRLFLIFFLNNRLVSYLALKCDDKSNLFNVVINKDKGSPLVTSKIMFKLFQFSNWLNVHL